MATIPAVRRHDLTDAQWAALQPLLPRGKKPGRPPKWDKRQLIDGIRWRVRVGCPWRDVPDLYGPWQTVYGLFRRWQRGGIWQQLLTCLQAHADGAGLIDRDVSVDSTITRAHQHAAGARARPQEQKEPSGGVEHEPADHALGRSRGGLTKLHLAERIRLFELAKASATKSRAQAINQLKAVLVGADSALRNSMTGLSNPKLIRRCADLNPGQPETPVAAAAYALRLLARRIIELTHEVEDLNQRITEAINAQTPELLQRYGVGPDTAAALFLAADVGAGLSPGGQAGRDQGPSGVGQVGWVGSPCGHGAVVRCLEAGSADVMSADSRA
ncbi:hypothetical protein GCM10027615_37150 [Plantactinospora veratri]